jgi:N-acyl-D-aspartate/D-glutamate deacylase
MRRIAFAGVVAASLTLGCSTPEFDVIITGGRIVDGTGTPSYRADVGIRGDQIVAIGDLAGHSSWIAVPARGQVVAPGFIDPLGRSGIPLLRGGHAESHVLQGITTVLLGEPETAALWTPTALSSEAQEILAGKHMWRDFADFFRIVEMRGMAVNAGSLVPAGQLQWNVAGASRAPTTEEHARMDAILARAVGGGAFGLSTSVPDASIARTQIERMVSTQLKAAGVYALHLNPGVQHAGAYVDQAVRLGAAAGVPVVVQRVTSELAGEVEKRLGNLLAQGWASIGSGSEAVALDEHGNGKTGPVAAFGTFPRVIRKFVRERRDVSLEHAIRSMTSLPASQFSIDRRGTLKSGYHADLVIFDPETVSEIPTTGSVAAPVGITTVLVNGMIVVREGQYMHLRAGRALRPVSRGPRP